MFASVFLLELIFTQKTNQSYDCCSLMQLRKASPQQVHHEITCSNSCRGYKSEEEEQDEYWGGVCCKGKGWIVGEDHKGRNNQEDEERGGGECPGFGC